MTTKRTDRCQVMGRNVLALCEALLRNVDDAVMITGADDRVLLVSKAAERLSGWSSRDVCGHPLARICSFDGKSGRAGARRGTVRCVLTSANGSKTHAEAHIVPLRGLAAAGGGTAIVLHSTEHRHAVGRHLVSKHKTETIGSLVRDVARDLGDLAGLLSGYALSLADTLIPKTRAHEDALKILDAVQRSGTLTNHLLRIARAAAPQSDKISPVRVDDLIADVSALLDTRMKARGISVTIRKSEALRAVAVNPDQLLNLLMLVFLNAMDATPNGGTITVQLSERAMVPRLKQRSPAKSSSRYVLLRIADKGSRAPAEALDWLFEPMQPGHAKGLGLTLMNHALQAWGGWVRAGANAGQGTAVTLYLPAAAPDLQVDAGLQGGAGIVLVLDDSRDDLAAFRTILEKEGYKVVAESRAEAGLEFFRQNARRIAVTIIDLVMPDMSGKDVFDTLTKHDPDASIVMTSGFSRDYVRGQIGRGGWHFVQKPIDRDRLLHAVRRAVAQRTLSEGLRESNGVPSTHGED